MIELGKKAAAECVAEALAEFGGELEESHGRWTVTVAERDVEFHRLFDALEACLRDNGIVAVKIAVGKRSYVMEGAS